MKKILTLLFAVLYISLSAQRLTLSEAITKDEINIHQQIENAEQNYLKYPLTYQTTNKWKTYVLSKDSIHYDYTSDIDQALLFSIDSIVPHIFSFRLDSPYIASIYYYHVFVAPKNTKILTHIFIGKNGFGIPSEAYSKYFIFKNGDIQQITIDEYTRGFTEF